MDKINSNPTDPLPDEPLANNISGEPAEGELQRRRHKRVKVRRRIRVKKRTGPKRKAKKTMETVVWVLIITAFLLTLIIMILQLDLNDKKVKKGAPVTMVYGLSFTFTMPSVNKLITSPPLNNIIITNLL